MVFSLKTFDVSKSGKMTELTQTKYRFGILVGFPYNIAYQTGFENSTSNTTHGARIVNKQTTHLLAVEMNWK